MKGYPTQQHLESSSQDMHVLDQQPGSSMFSRLKETLSRATRSDHATNEINEGGWEVDLPFTSQIDPVLSVSVHVSTPATTSIGSLKLTLSETLLLDGRRLAEVQEVECYIPADREREIESLRKAEQCRAILAKAPMTSMLPANPLQFPELIALKSQTIGSYITSSSKDTPNTSILDGVFLDENWEYILQTETLIDLYTSYTYHAVIANGPFEKWEIDAMGPLPRTANGKLYILVVIDYMTRWIEAQSVAKVNEKTVSKFVYTHICCRFGTPLEIVSDNGPGFRRGLLTEVCEELKVSHRHSTPYYPQSNGLVEKANGIITGIIRKMVESKPKRWDNFLDGAIWAYKTTYRDATQFTPFHLVYGQEALQPIELNIPIIKLTGRQEQNNDEAWIDRLLNLVELEWKREATYHCYKKKTLQLKDKPNEGIKDKEIKEKSLVLRYNNAFDAKFECRWEGLFIVKKAFTGGYYQLMDLNGKEHP
ncbi:hypothetical protein L7F22_013372 [Adiantum nelumboides]|nr:hypothetical protein [Adiantum nelumboides]